MFRRHCVVVEWMSQHSEFEWIFFNDGDMAVINPNHSLFKYINGEQIIFYDRIYNHEIMSGSYLAKLVILNYIRVVRFPRLNTIYGRNFLRDWADYFYKVPKSFHGRDNGALHGVFMEKFAAEQDRNKCQHLYEISKDYDDLWRFEVCTRYFMEKQMVNRTFDGGRVRLFPKAAGWGRDGTLTETKFSTKDFMFHGWKASTLDKKVDNLYDWKYPFKARQNFYDDKFYCSNKSEWEYNEDFVEEEDKINETLKRIINKIDIEYNNILKELKLT
uniref:Glycosyltransferase family 92 protein n=1 Tax=Meloidogyne incognita TaxID=6306 RepID=A0A914M389_MELIC